MKKYSEGFYTLMSEAGILSRASFDGYLKDVIGFGNSQALNLDGFAFEPAMQLNFDYEQIQVENRIKVMATYTDKDSEAIPFGTKGFTTSRGVIPRQKARFLMDEDDYRKYLSVVRDLDIQGQSIKNYALDILFNGLSDIKDAHITSMTYQRDQMVSNRSLTLSAANNPRGIKGLTFSASVPSANVTTLTGDYRWWTDADKTVQGSASNPVKDMRDIVRAMKRKGYTTITVEVDEVSFLQDMDHTAWRTAIGYYLQPTLRQTASNDANAQAVANLASDDQLKAAFKAIIDVAEVKYKQGLVGVETLNSESKELVRTPFRSFNANTYVFYPSGPLGTIKVVSPLTPDDTAMYGKFLGGRGIIQYEYNAKQKVQDWWSEFTGLCVPNRVNEMYYLITK